MPEEEMLDAVPCRSNTDQVDYVEEKVRELLEREEADDFDEWTSLITQVEKNTPSCMQKISLVYDSFLSKFPLCYGYWKKYASHMARICCLKEVEQVYERAVKAAAYSVDLWASYCSFGELSYEPPNVRRLYKRSFSFVGRDYLCYLLWDQYIKFEYSQKQWSQLAHIYINTLRYPTKLLHNYYERFKSLVAVLEEEMGKPEKSIVQSETTDSESSGEITYTKTCGYAEVMNIIRDIFDQQDGLCRSTSLKKYLSVGELLYEKSSELDKKITFYETGIRRPYFHVKALDDRQLQNWHHYLDFVEMQGDFDWAVKLYERCLIPCASYSEFWIRYAEFVEPKCGREIAKYAITRASTVFLKKVPAFHVYSAMFMESVGDVVGARAASLACGIDSVPIFIENVNQQANRERRLGNIESACKIYTDAIEMAKMRPNNEILPVLYTNFARFTFAVSGSTDDAGKVFIDGIHQTPCKLIIEGLILFLTVHGGKEYVAMLDSTVANAISPGSDVSEALSSHDRENISKLFLEFVDLYGTINEIRLAWDRHRRLFPHTLRPPPPTTSVSFATVKDFPSFKSLEGTEILISSSTVANGINKQDNADTQVMDVLPLKSNIAATENMPFESRIDEYLSFHNTCDKSEHGQDVQSINSPTFIADADRLCDEIKKGSKELEKIAEVVEQQSKVDTPALPTEVDKSIYSHYVTQTSHAFSESAETEHPVQRLREPASVAHLPVHALHNLSINSLDNGCQEVDKSIHEDHYVVQTLQVPSDCTESEILVHGLPDREPNAALMPPTLENPSISSPGDGIRTCNRITSPHRIACELNSRPDADNSKVKVGDDEDVGKHPSGLVHLTDGNHTRETPSGERHQMQVQEETNLQQVLAVDSQHSQNVGLVGGFSQKHYAKQAPDDSSGIHHDYVQPSQTQQHLDLLSDSYSQAVISQEESNMQQPLFVDGQHHQNPSTSLGISGKYYGGHAPDASGVTYEGCVPPSQTPQVFTDPQSVSASNSPIVISQGQIYPAQTWINTQDQQANQMQGQHSTSAAAQIHPNSNLTLAGQNVQQAVILGQPQASDHPAVQPQSQVYQSTLQSNAQYGYFQNGQVVQPQMWQYYQQLYYFQQQQQQQNQLIESHPQQQWQTEQLQQQQNQLIQSHPQQQWQTEQLQQLQQNLVQQQSQNQQQGPNQQQHQSQFLQWNQQVSNTQQQQNQMTDYTQQQQYVLYLQQQQLYVQQQQQLYMQQQQAQLLQQQMLQQQQQQQQQLLQQQQQQQSSASEPTTSNSNFYLQGEEDRLQNTEQSRSSRSHTPQNL